MLKSNKGVTLVALVVTIIVLIILAAVSITMVLGNDGIWKHAEDARDLTANSIKYEEARMNEFYQKADEIISNVTK